MPAEGRAAWRRFQHRRHCSSDSARCRTQRFSRPQRAQAPRRGGSAGGGRFAEGRRVEARQGPALPVSQRSTHPVSPILLVMSLVSKPYVFDLRPGNSFVEALLARGFDVYMLDWGDPDAADAENRFETYCDEYIPFASRGGCARAASTSSTCSDTAWVVSLRWCSPPGTLRSRCALSLLATPIDFAVMGGVIHCSVTGVSMSSRPDRRDGKRAPRERAARCDHDRVTGDWSRTRRFSRTSRTVSTSPPTRRCTAGPTTTSRFRAHAFIRWRNGWCGTTVLAPNRLVTSRGPLDLTSIGCPVMNAVGTKDHIVPIESNRPLLHTRARARRPPVRIRSRRSHRGRKAHRVSIPAMAEWLEGHSDTR